MTSSAPTQAPTLTFFFRHPRPEYHSIERLFTRLATQVRRQAADSSVRQVYCPRSRVTPLNLLRNCWYARRHRGTINHITGDVHYLALALPRRSTLLTIHDCVLLTRYPAWHPMHWFYYYVWYKWPVSRAGVVTTISEKSKAELVQAVGIAPSKIRVIPNFYDPALTPAPTVPKPEPVLLQVGTGPNKNLERLIEAIAGLPCRLVIIGQPTDAQLARLRTHRIVFQALPNVDEATLRQAYADADLVVFASLYEGFGLPILEAQAMNRPVITSRREPMRTIAGDGAALVDPTDPTAIRAAIDRILGDALYRHQLVTSGQANAACYTVDQITAHYLALYDSIPAN